VGEAVSWGEQECDTTCCCRSLRTGRSSHCIADIAVPIGYLVRHPTTCSKALPPCAGNQDTTARASQFGLPTSTCALSGQAGDANPKLERPALSHLEAATPAVWRAG